MFFSFTPTLRALTAGSPITTAIHETHRMARRHLETGGAVPTMRRGSGSGGFALPPDVDPAALAAALDARLSRGGLRRDRSRRMLNSLEAMADRRIVVPQIVVERLGGGNAVRGEWFLERLISDIRSRRALAASRSSAG